MHLVGTVASTCTCSTSTMDAPKLGNQAAALVRLAGAAQSAETPYWWLHSGYTAQSKKKPRYRFDSGVSLFHGGEGGIRTLGDVATTPDFESDKFCISLR